MHTSRISRPSLRAALFAVLAAAIALPLSAQKSASLYPPITTTGTSLEVTADPLVARMLDQVERRTGLPVVINTSLNTAGRPMVDSPRDALECFGSAPVDVLALGPYLIRRKTSFVSP